jgi:predicted RNase H-like HicB family nuclease
MQHQSNGVKLSVTASVPMECEFWTQDDGWKGVCAQLSLTVLGNSFEEAKKHMEATLQTYIEGVLRERKLAA